MGKYPTNPIFTQKKMGEKPTKKYKNGEKMSNKEIKEEMNEVIKELEDKGITLHSHIKNDDMVGLGDVVESTLKKFGITEERFKQWFGLKECGCSKRKKWLNGLFKWKARK